MLQDTYIKGGLGELHFNQVFLLNAHFKPISGSFKQLVGNLLLVPIAFFYLLVMTFQEPLFFACRKKSPARVCFSFSSFPAGFHHSSPLFFSALSGSGEKFPNL